MLGQRPKSRLLNLRILVLLGLSTVVFIGILLVTGSGRNSYEVLVANGYLAPGQKFTELAYTRLLLSGDPLSSARGEVFLTPENVDQFYGRIVVNGVYPGDPIRTSDFYRPACDEAALVTPDASADPSGVAQGTFVYRLSELLCEGRRIVVIDGDRLGGKGSRRGSKNGSSGSSGGGSSGRSSSGRSCGRSSRSGSSGSLRPRAGTRAVTSASSAFISRF